MNPDVQVALIAAGATVLVAGLSVFGEMLRRNIRDIKGHAESTTAQVRNSHSTNLRDDIDRLLHGQERVFVELEGMRNELRQERIERMAGDKAAVAALTVIHGGGSSQ